MILIRKTNSLLWALMLIGWSDVSHAQIIRLTMGGAKFLTSASQLSITNTVDSVTPAVLTGTISDQSFRDDTVGAAYFGYYISTGIRTTLQLTGSAVNLKIKKGSSETSGRSYYLLGNGVTTPTQQSNLAIAPTVYTTFVSAAKNGKSCGTNWSVNGLPNTGTNGCNTATIVTNMDITQFVKILFTDPPSTPIISQLEFIAAVE